MELLKVLAIRRGENPCVIHINNTLETMQKFVGGFIEIVPLGDDIVLVCDEEGKIKGKEISCILRNKDGKIIDYIAGDCFICSTQGEELTDFRGQTGLTLTQLQEITLPEVWTK